MPPKKTNKMVVKLKLPSSKLQNFVVEKLPAKSLSAAKSKLLEDASRPQSPSPFPGNTPSAAGSNLPRFNVTKAMTINDISAKRIDISDKVPVRKWTKQPISIRSFSGFTVALPGWAGGAREGDQVKQKKKPAEEKIKVEEPSSGMGSPTPA